MYNVSVSKELFEDILLKKESILYKKNSTFWKKELLEPKIEAEQISYSIKQLDKITLTNGLGEDKPQMVIKCDKVDYCSSSGLFEFHLGEIIEQKNVSFSTDYKDVLISQLLKEKQLLEDSLNKDYLTQVYNRRKMEIDLEKLIRKENTSLLTAIFIDADRFKGINDNFGHDTGDKVLIYIAQRLDYFAKKLQGNVYRYGGEEFVILSLLPKEKMALVINELRQDIKSKKIYHPKRDIAITVSLGISFYIDYNDKWEFLKKADEAVYKAKKNGRDRVEFA